MTAKTNEAPKLTTTPSIDTSKFTVAGMNVSYLVQDDILFIAIPVSEKVLASARPSTSGKSKTVGSTLGNVAIAGTAIKLGVNAYVPNTAR